MANLHFLTDYMCMRAFKCIQVYEKCSAAGILRGTESPSSYKIFIPYMHKRPYKTYDLANSEDTGHISANMKDFLTRSQCSCAYTPRTVFHAANKDLELWRRPTAATSPPRTPSPTPPRGSTMPLKIKVNQMCSVTPSSATKGATSRQFAAARANATHTHTPTDRKSVV